MTEEGKILHDKEDVDLPTLFIMAHDNTDQSTRHSS